MSTAAVVVEIVSPDDESFAKLPFYAARGVEEALLVLPDSREVQCFDLSTGVPVRAEASAVLGVSMAALSESLDWPTSS